MEAAAPGSKRAYSVIVPTYNERLNVSLIIYLLLKNLPYVSMDYSMPQGNLLLSCIQTIFFPILNSQSLCYASTSIELSASY
ncbi:hypothetical protein BAE44_0014252 [Dichanthelium oligosanthes]|uniref:Uncharacterized protein n=1 Tax=Dichanthelium oligosanthes TaxID=888268 RepID=A0A1E5VHZ4_9POAL|nr:hypothetical protein BAE44_0014252 [Dichanthelium oligosanthes]